jgi:hypothetical protein
MHGMIDDLYQKMHIFKIEIPYVPLEKEYMYVK